MKPDPAQTTQLYLGARPICDPIARAGAPTQSVAFVDTMLVAVSDALAERLAAPDLAGGADFEGARARFSGAVAVEQEQVWRLLDLELGDLVGELSLAPGEQLDIEMRTTTRISTERTVEQSTQVERSLESTTSNREAQATTSSAASSNQWSRTDSGSVSLGLSVPVSEGVSLNLGGSASTSSSSSGALSSASSSSVQRTHEETMKAATKVTSSTKVTFKTTTEKTTEHREARRIVNPKDDATMHLFAYEVLKRFRVVTFARTARPALVAHIEPLAFDASFVATHAGFLGDCLVDARLRDRLDDAVVAAQREQAVIAGKAGTAVNNDASLDQLSDQLTVLEQILFEDFGDNDEDLCRPVSAVHRDTIASFFLEETKFEPDVFNNLNEATSRPGWRAFIAWRYLRYLYDRDKHAPSGARGPAARCWATNRALLLKGFAEHLQQVWTSEAMILNLIDDKEISQPCRRIEAFFAVSRIVFGLPAAGPDGATPVPPPIDDGAPQREALAAVIAHLDQHAQHYTAKLLEWASTLFGRNALVPLANAALLALSVGLESAGKTSANSAVLRRATVRALGGTPWCGLFLPSELAVAGATLIIPLAQESISQNAAFSPAVDGGRIGLGATFFGLLDQLIDVATPLRDTAYLAAALAVQAIEAEPEVPKLVTGAAASAVPVQGSKPPVGTSGTGIPKNAEDYSKSVDGVTGSSGGGTFSGSGGAKAYTAAAGSQKPSVPKQAELPTGAQADTKVAETNAAAFVHVEEHVRMLAEGAHLVYRFESCGTTT